MYYKIEVLFTNENNEDHNEQSPFGLDHPYRILIIGVLDQEKQINYLI